VVGVTTRQIVTAVALVFVAAFAFLTVVTAVKHGIDILTLISLGVLVLLAVGIIGALSQGGRDD
jgi:hypothetical protein